MSEGLIYKDDVDYSGGLDEPRRPSGLVTTVVVILLLIVAVVAGLGASAVLARRPHAYASQAVLMIDQEPILTASANDGIINKLVRLRIKYVDEADTTTFASELADKLGLPPGRVHAALTGAAPQGSLLVAVKASDSDPVTTQQIAQGAAELLRDKLAADQVSLSIPANQRVTLTIVTPAGEGLKTSPSRNRIRLAGLVVGFGAFVAGLAIADVIRRRRRA